MFHTQYLGIFLLRYFIYIIISSYIISETITYDVILKCENIIDTELCSCIFKIKYLKPHKLKIHKMYKFSCNFFIIFI
jgi:hypothetical protein